MSASSSRPGKDKKDQTPPDLPSTNPPASALDSHSWLFQSIMEVQKSVGGLNNAVERLIEDTASLSTKIGAANTSIDRFRTITITLGVVIPLFCAFFSTFAWWAIGEKINTLLKPTSPAIVESVGKVAPTIEDNTVLKSGKTKKNSD